MFEIVDKSQIVFVSEANIFYQSRALILYWFATKETEL